MAGQRTATERERGGWRGDDPLYGAYYDGWRARLTDRAGRVWRL